jgi:hypothetical protein
MESYYEIHSISYFDDSSFHEYLKFLNSSQKVSDLSAPARSGTHGKEAEERILDYFTKITEVHSQTTKSLQIYPRAFPGRAKTKSSADPPKSCAPCAFPRRANTKSSDLSESCTPNDARPSLAPSARLSAPYPKCDFDFCGGEHGISQQISKNMQCINVPLYLSSTSLLRSHAQRRPA